MRSLLLAAALAIAGCAAASKVTQIGPNRYQIGADATQTRGGTVSAERMATEGAATTCAAKGMQLNVLSVETGKTYFSAGTANVTFECLPKQAGTDAILARLTEIARLIDSHKAAVSQLEQEQSALKAQLHASGGQPPAATP